MSLSRIFASTQFVHRRTNLKPVQFLQCAKARFYLPINLKNTILSKKRQFCISPYKSTKERVDCTSNKGLVYHEAYMQIKP